MIEEAVFLKNKFLLIPLFLAIILAGTSLALESGQIETRIVLSHSGYSAGNGGILAVVFDVPEDHHITELELGLFYVTVNPPDGIQFTEPRFPEPVEFEGLEVFQGTNVVFLDFSIDENLSPGDYSIQVEYGYQVCAETGTRICYLPFDETSSLTISVIEKGVTPLPSNDPVFAQLSSTTSHAGQSIEDTSLEGKFTKALNEGSLLVFLLVFIAGILTSFTPCVYPVIPITIGFIGGRADGKKMTGFMLSIFLVLGLATIYSILGVAAAATGSVFGSYAQHPAVIIIIAGIFAVMGASMLGLFEIQVPASIQGKMQTQKRGFVGAYLVGMVTGIVAAPCVGPVLVALLTWVSQTGNIALGFVLLFTFALGMGLLFIVIGTFAGAMSALPGSGSWMETIKHAFGAILIAGAIFFLRPLLSSGLYQLLWGILLISVGIFNDVLNFSSEGKRWGKIIGVIFLTSGLIFFVSGFRSVFGFEPTHSSNTATVKQAGIEWIVNDTEKAFTEAELSGKNVLMDFYADWCVSCVELEEETWPSPELIAMKNSWVFLKMDLTKMTPALKAIQDEYGVRGMPTVIFFNSEGVETGRFSGFKSASDVKNLMSSQ